ncbi:hypothetical protein [uncultured Mucilaginibacter sp.]|nr:hypothetical protein [uncultured Mucilaginibacter sp.]
MQTIFIVFFEKNSTDIMVDKKMRQISGMEIAFKSDCPVRGYLFVVIAP